MKKSDFFASDPKHSSLTKTEREGHGGIGDAEERGVTGVKGKRDNAEGGIRTVTVMGQIEGHTLLSESQKTTKYELLLPALAAIEEDRNVKGLLVLLNTVGGDVEAGLAIAEMIASMRKPTVSLVLGGSHSIGVPLAVSARVSFIVSSASMTIHPVRISGTVIGAPQTYVYLERVQKRIMRFVADHSKMSEERFHALMMVPDELATDIGSVLDGEAAVREGLIDRVGGLSDALDALWRMIDEAESGTEAKMKKRAENPSET